MSMGLRFEGVLAVRTAVVLAAGRVQRADALHELSGFVNLPTEVDPQLVDFLGQLKQTRFRLRPRTWIARVGHPHDCSASNCRATSVRAPMLSAAYVCSRAEGIDLEGEARWAGALRLITPPPHKSARWADLVAAEGIEPTRGVTPGRF